MSERMVTVNIRNISECLSYIGHNHNIDYTVCRFEKNTSKISKKNNASEETNRTSKERKKED